MNNSSIRVYTYSDPFKLNERQFWGDVIRYPHICASHTLVQGLNWYYKRGCFTILCSEEDLLSKFYRGWMDDIATDIRRLTDITDEIGRLKQRGIEEDILSAFRKSKRELLSSLKMLIELNVRAEGFGEDSLSRVEQVFLEMYRNISSKRLWAIEEYEMDLDERLGNALLQIFVDEISRNAKMEHVEIDFQNKDKEQIWESIRKLIIETTSRGILEEKEEDILEFNELMGDKQWSPHQCDFEGIFKNVYDLYQPHTTKLREKKLVFHGIHHFNPLLIRFIKLLIRNGYEVIFLIPYNNKEEVKKFYETWKNVYTSWTEVDFDSIPPENIKISEKALPLVNLFGNANVQGVNRIPFFEFSSISHITNHISNIYMRAKKESGKDGALSKMTEQFYSLRASALNDILKIYHPEQFGERHFLAYPVGQFILALYTMWEKGDYRYFAVDEGALYECLAFNIWTKGSRRSPVEIYENVKLYLKKCLTLDECIERLKALKEKRRRIDSVQEEFFKDDIKRFSFYAIDEDDIDFLIGVFEKINKIGRKIFEDSGKTGRVRFKAHFKKLLNVLNEEIEGTQDEEEMEEIKKMLLGLLQNLEQNEGDVDGTIEDLKEVIFYYLHVVEKNNKPNWIVRGIEQLDGGVMLSKRQTDDRKYHICLLSDEILEKNLKEMFPFPLSRRFFESYQGDRELVGIFLRTLNEYEKFLLYSLFYTLCFCEREVFLSYCVEDSDLERNTPLYIIRLLGLKKEKFGYYEFGKEEDERSGKPPTDLPSTFRPSLQNISLENREIFVVCPFRFFLNFVFDGDRVLYRDEFLCRYYWILVLRDIYWMRNQGKGPISPQDIEKDVSTLLDGIKRFVDFWDDLELADVLNKVVFDIEDDDIGCYDKEQKTILGYDSNYMRRKLNLLMWKVDDAHKFDFREAENEGIIRKIMEYLSEPSYDIEPYEELCKYCNQNQYCIERYFTGE